MDGFINKMSDIAKSVHEISPKHYATYDIKRGLRNSDGTGVLVGLTQIGDVRGYKWESGQKFSKEGELFYREYELNILIDKLKTCGNSKFEGAAFLLLFGRLPKEGEFEEFLELLSRYRMLPDGYTENMILKIPSRDIMNKLQRSTLVLYSHDESPEDLSIENVLKQSLFLIARYPTIAAYGYQAKRHYFDNESLWIHTPPKNKGAAETILTLTRADKNYTQTEAEILDLSLLLHAEHGGGNNSTFATHVVSSSGTDTYSAMASALGCLKGNKHGGANIKVKKMMDDLKTNCKDYSAESIEKYLKDILSRKAFDGKGLIYGMGHAVYTKSDPRAEILKKKAKQLAIEKDSLNEYEMYVKVEAIAKRLFKELKGESFEIAANVDFYSGFVYDKLGIPEELYTPLFACARIVGWSAHRLEQLMSDTKIIRPAYQWVK